MSNSAAFDELGRPPRAFRAAASQGGAIVTATTTSAAAPAPSPQSAPARAAPDAAASASSASNGKKGSYVQHVESFNKLLKLLVTDMAVRFKNDPMVYRAKERTMSAIALTPMYIIDLVGAYLFSYREKIYDQQTSFFLEQNYDKELKESIKPAKAEMVKYIMPKLKSAWATLNVEQQQQYQSTVISMLDAYIEYLSAKQLGD